MDFSQSFKYEIKDKKVYITGFDSKDTTVEVPEEIEGYPVAGIAPYAFGDRANVNLGRSKNVLTTSPIKEISLPKTMERIGRYAFYNCRDLRRIQLYNGVKDLGAGAFTGCHKVREIDVTFLGNEKSCLKEFLVDLTEEQTLFYHSEAGEAKLVFPEFFEEAVENTPARILETHTHGSGMMYRNCFVQQELQFQQYDDRFEWAKGSESKETLFRLAFSRLLYPYQLSEKAKRKYEAFLKEHFEECAVWAFREQSEKEIRYLAEHCVENAGELEVLIRESNRQKEAGILSYLMDYKHRNFKTRRKTFEL